MRTFVLFLVISWLFPSVAISQSTSSPTQTSSQSSPTPDNLSEDELRIVLQFFDMLTLAEKKNMSYEKYIERDLKEDERERANAARALEVEQRATELAEKEKEMALEQAKHYETLYKSVTKKKGFWCGFKRFWSLGFHRC